jgi:hypothetical protein
MCQLLLVVERDDADTDELRARIGLQSSRRRLDGGLRLLLGDVESWRTPLPSLRPRRAGLVLR